jgi:hypothetical protein
VSLLSCGPTEVDETPGLTGRACAGFEVRDFFVHARGTRCIDID